MTQTASLADLFLAAAVIGLLFIVCAFLTLRRIGAMGERPGIGAFRRAARAAFRTDAFGPDREPERRSAVRQIHAAIVFAGLAVAIGGWGVASSVLGPFLTRGFGG